MFVNDNDYEDISEKAAKQKKAVHTKFEVVHCSRQLLVRTVRLLMVMFSFIKTLQRHCIFGNEMDITLSGLKEAVYSSFDRTFKHLLTLVK